MNRGPLDRRTEAAVRQFLTQIANDYDMASAIVYGAGRWGRIVQTAMPMSP